MQNIFFFSGTDHDIEMNSGTDVDGAMESSAYSDRTQSESPISELDKLKGDNSSDNESMKSGTEGHYIVNREESLSPGARPNRNFGNSDDIGHGDASDRNSQHEVNNFDFDKENEENVEPVEKKKKSNRRLTDSFIMEKSGSEGSGRLNETFGGSRPSSAASSSKSGTPGKEKGEF